MKNKSRNLSSIALTKARTEVELHPTNFYN